MRAPQHCCWRFLIIALFVLPMTGCLDSELRDYGFPDTDPRTGRERGEFGRPLREADPRSHTGYFFNDEAQSIESRLGYNRE
jgi:hypothetical protein